MRAVRKGFDRAAGRVANNTHKFLLDRWDNLRLARREMVVWLFLVVVLIAIGAVQALFATYNVQVVAARSGGTYAEGVVDKITTINPIFASTDTEKAASRLVYSSLLEYDETNHLRGDLATTWSVSDDGKGWNVKLRNNVKWSDGQKLTAKDVVFTVNLIKNQAAGSPLASSWRTIEIAKISDNEVQFTLANAYMSFPGALTFGILPEHIFRDFSPAEIKNIQVAEPGQAIGSGPFVFKIRETLANGQAVWRFAPNERYYGGQPNVNFVTIRTYAGDKELIDGLNRGEVNAAADISIASVPRPLKQGQRLVEAPLADGVFALFNNSAPNISDKNIREALRLGTDRAALREASVKKGLSVPEALDTPIARGVYGSVDALEQPDFDAKAAAEKLDAADWKLNDKKLREKDGQTLTLNVVTIKGVDYEPVAKALVEQWRKLGVDAKLVSADANLAQQNYLMPRNYDVLVYQLHLGADPDELAYWSSSQALATGLNFANYKSRSADLILSGGRTQMNAAARETRYVDFAKLWLADAPAIALYQPNFYYISGAGLNTLNNAPLVSSDERFRDILDWTVRTGTVNTTP